MTFEALPPLHFCLLVLIAIAVALHFALRLLLRSKTSPAGPLLIAYFLSLLLYFGSLAAGTILNPRDMVHGSPSDPFLKATTAIGFFTALVLPFRLPIKWEFHLAFLFLNVVILWTAFYGWYTATA